MSWMSRSWGLEETFPLLNLTQSTDASSQFSVMGGEGRQRVQMHRKCPDFASSKVISYLPTAFPTKRQIDWF